MDTFWSIVLPPNPAVQMILAVVAALTILALVLVGRAAAQVRAERASVRLIAARLTHLDGVAVAENLPGPHQRSAAGQLVQGMLRHKGLAHTSLEVQLARAHSAVSAQLTPLRAWPNALLLLGLVGTVIGLGFTLTQMAPQIQNALKAASPTLVSDSLGHTLNELRGAFAGTFWGVLGGLAVQARLTFALRELDALAADLETLALDYAPLVYPASTAQQLQSLQDVVTSAQRTVEAGQAAAERTQQLMAETSREFKAVLSEAGQVMQQSLDSLRETSRHIGQSMEAFASAVQASSARLQGVARNLGQYHQELRNAQTQLQEMFDASMQRLTQHSEMERGQLNAIREAFEATGVSVLSELQGTARKLDDTAQQVRDGAERFAVSAQGVTTSVQQGFEGLRGGLREVLSDYTGQINVVALHIERLNTLLEAATGQLQQGPPVFLEEGRQLREALASLTQQLGSVLKAHEQLARLLQHKDQAEFTRQKDLERALAQLGTAIMPLNNLPAQVSEAGREGQLLRAELHAHGAEQLRALQALQALGQEALNVLQRLPTAQQLAGAVRQEGNGTEATPA